MLITRDLHRFEQVNLPARHIFFYISVLNKRCALSPDNMNGLVERLSLYKHIRNDVGSGSNTKKEITKWKIG